MPSNQNTKAGSVVTKEELEEIWIDLVKMTTPSWIGSVPKYFFGLPVMESWRLTNGRSWVSSISLSPSHVCGDPPVWIPGLKNVQRFWVSHFTCSLLLPLLCPKLLPIHMLMLMLNTWPHTCKIYMTSLPSMKRIPFIIWLSIYMNSSVAMVLSMLGGLSHLNVSLEFCNGYLLIGGSVGHLYL